MTVAKPYILDDRLIQSYDNIMTDGWKPEEA